MEELKHRQWAKLIAISDIILSGISLTLLAFVALHLLLATVGFHMDMKETIPADADGTMMFVILWIVATLLILAEIVKVLAAIKLLRACKIETLPEEALGLCTTWRNVNVFFLVLNAFNFIIGNVGWGIVTLMIYAISLYIVNMYMQELIEFIENPHPCPVIMTGQNGHMMLPGKFNEGETGVSFVFYGPPPPYSPSTNQPPPY